MGWLFSYNSTRQQVVDAIFRNLKGLEYATILDHASTCYGKRLWVSVEYNREGKKETLVLLFLLQKGDSSYCGWGYKDLDESAYPYYFDCPLRLLRGEPVNENAKRWREAVVNFHNQRKTKRAKRTSPNQEARA